VREQTKFRFRRAGVVSGSWGGLGRWVSATIIVLVWVLTCSGTALAAADGRSPDQLAALSPLPTPTSIPTSSSGFYYTVCPGDTLSRIAWRFGTTVSAIVSANGIINPNQIFYGQVLWIPSTSGGPSGSNVYIVQRGDTLSSIARRFGTTYQALAALNGLHYPYTIYVGQRLVVSGSGTPWPAPSPSQRVHIVQRGDTLYSIALRYGTTPWAIAALNRLWNLNLIYVGQRLFIP
jgi:LysM repeat protein